MGVPRPLPLSCPFPAPLVSVSSSAFASATAAAVAVIGDQGCNCRRDGYPSHFTGVSHGCGWVANARLIVSDDRYQPHSSSDSIVTAIASSFEASTSFDVIGFAGLLAFIRRMANLVARPASHIGSPFPPSPCPFPSGTSSALPLCTLTITSIDRRSSGVILLDDKN